MPPIPPLTPISSDREIDSNMNKPLVVIPADDPVQIGQSPQLARLRDVAEVRIHTTRVESVADQVARVKDADVMINSRGYVKWRAESLGQLPKLRMITTCSVGTDSIDLTAAAEAGIVVCNIPGKTAPVVAEHTLGMILAVAKRMAFQTAELKAGRWTALPNVMLAGRTLGVIGAGAIGAEVSRVARAIGMNVIAWTFNPTAERAEKLGLRFVALDDLLRASDVVSVHVKLTRESRRLIGERELALMKPGSLFINTSRGAVVDTAALIRALDEGRLAGAALDVFDKEPLPADDPILRCEQIVLTPHHADQTPEGKELLNVGAVENVLAFLNGTPQNVVT